MNAIEIQGLCKTYAGFQLADLNLTLPQGCIMGLVGANGAGKSTTIKVMLDMIARDSGSIRILGQNNRDRNMEDIGVVLDEVGICGCLNARQVGKIMALSFQNWDDAVYNDYLHRFDLPKTKNSEIFPRG